MNTKMKILLIDSDFSFGAKLEESLKKNLKIAHTLHLASNMTEAKKEMKINEFDLVIIDPHIEGPSAAENIKSIKTARFETTVIIITSQNGENCKNALESLNAGAQDYILKSELNYDALPKIINYAIKRQLILNGLYESATKYETIFDTSAASTFIVDEDMTILQVNGEFEKRSGYKKQEIENKIKVSELLYEKDREIALKYHFLRRQNSVAAPSSYETRIVTKNGSVRHAILSVKLIDGTKKSIVTALDVTEQKNITEALAASEEKFYALMSMASDAIILADESDSISYWNHAAEKIFGYGQKEAIGKNFFYLMAPPSSRDEYKKHFSLYENSSCIELSAIKKDGESFDAEFSFSIIQFKQKWHTVFIIRDISARKKAELELKRSKEEAEKANSYKSQFLANMSHEIRTPMTSIMGMTELARKTKLSDEQSEYLEIINQSSRHLLSIIDDILDLARIEANKVAIKNEAFNLKSLVTNTLEMFLTKASEKKIMLTSNINPKIPEILEGDYVRIQQVLINLLGNALKFTEHGEIELNVKPVAYNAKTVKICFEVSDSGIGISKEKQKELFKPFSQLDMTDTKKFGGTGLGLVISKRLIELMKGMLCFDSIERLGSKFWFVIDLVIDSKNTEKLKNDFKSASSEDQSKEFRVPANYSVLLVEDNLFNQKLIFSYLQKCGINDIVCVTDGRKCADIFLKRNFSVILMDCQMPIMDGYTSSKLIREYETAHKRPKTPIIALTADAMPGTREKCMEYGMDDYLTKPIDFELLSNQLKKLAGADKSGRCTAEENKATINGIKDDFFNDKMLIELQKLQLPGKADIICELLKMYLKDTPSKFEILKNALAEHDFETIKQIAHNLKSSSANVGGAKLSSLMKSLELAARISDADSCDNTKCALETEYKKLCDKLNEIILERNAR